jgi:lysylphosphatidylglycerol synthetase-like protein (DUF2156 family)
MTPELGTTNMWLAILAVVSLLEFTAVTVALVITVRMIGRLAGEVREFQTAHLVPLITETRAALRDVHDITARVRLADDQLRERARQVGSLVGRASAALRWPVLPMVALAQAIRAAFAAYRGSSHPSQTRPPLIDLDADDEARLVSEGGHEPGDSTLRMWSAGEERIENA